MFEWTIGGMGLTGIIIRAAIKLRPIETCWIKQKTLVANNIDQTLEIFEKNISGPNQIHKQREDVKIDAKDLLDFNPTSPITESGLRQNISIGIQYIGAWLAGMSEYCNDVGINRNRGGKQID